MPNTARVQNNIEWQLNIPSFLKSWKMSISLVTIFQKSFGQKVSKWCNGHFGGLISIKNIFKQFFNSFFHFPTFEKLNPYGNCFVVAGNNSLQPKALTSLKSMNAVCFKPQQFTF